MKAKKKGVSKATEEGRVQFRPHRIRSRQKSRKPKWTHRILTLTLKTRSHPRNLTLKSQAVEEDCEKYRRL